MSNRLEDTDYGRAWVDAGLKAFEQTTIFGIPARELSIDQVKAALGYAMKNMADMHAQHAHDAAFRREIRQAIR